MDHQFNVENLGANNVNVLVTNLATTCDTIIHFVIEAQGVPEISNVFTPNGDQWNNTFSFGEHFMDNIDVSIYNRWGQLVTSFNGAGESWEWDGEDENWDKVPEGVYFYVLVAEGEDGHYYDYKGSITLLR